MNDGAKSPSVRYDPRFLEQVVFLAMRGHPLARAFHMEREEIYELENPEKREEAFRRLHLKWFVRLKIDEPMEKATREQPLIASAASSIILALAPAKSEEGAELFVKRPEGHEKLEERTVRLLLRPESLLNPQAFLTFLRHEFMHVADMLDPLFGYEPRLPVVGGGPARDRLLQDRYRILWDTTIDGRMVRRGWAPESVREERRAEFHRAFPMVGDEVDGTFSHFFDQEPHTHAELVAFACNPIAALPKRKGAPNPGSRCPLCRFPTHVFEPEPERLPEDALSRILQDFPAWNPSYGLCGQCADLYRAQAVSLQAARSLPGSHSARNIGD